MVPQNLRAEILQAIHTGHLGLNKCRERAKMSVWWPRILQEIEDLIRRCDFCNSHRAANPNETLKPTTLPDRPWQKLGTDILKLEGEYYLVVTDYFSRYLEIARLNPLTSKTIIGKLREIFARWGIPEEIVSDNGGQFTSTYFKEFAKQYGFTHTTVSPHFPQANGAAESAVKIAKRILRQPDIFLALMAYRSTPITATGVSPAELLMGRKIKTTLPSHPNKLKPKWPNLRKVKERDGVYKTKSKINYDKRHGSKDLKPLRVGDRI